MSTFKGHAKSLGEQYVFYQRLKTDGYYPKLSQYVSNASYRIILRLKNMLLMLVQFARKHRQNLPKKKCSYNRSLELILTLTIIEIRMILKRLQKR